MGVSAFVLCFSYASFRILSPNIIRIIKAMVNMIMGNNFL